MKRKRCGAYRLDVGDSFYIGSSWNADKRRAQHVTDLRQGTHPNKGLQRAWDKSPEKVSMSIMRPVYPVEGEEDVTSFRDRLRAAEQELLDHFSGDERMVNVSKSSRGPDSRPDMQERWKDAEFRDTMSAMLRNRVVSEETRLKMSAAKRGGLNYKSRSAIVVWPCGKEETFETVSAAAAKLGVSQQLADLWISGKVALPGEGRGCRKKHLIGMRIQFQD